MKVNIDELCKDPLFQLNLVIWLAQPQSDEYFYVYPLFYESGIHIHSIPKELPIPPDIRLKISQLQYDCQESAKPDLILETNHIPKKFCLLECKASSFSVDSKNPHPVRQSRALLLITGPVLSEVLAIGKRGQNEGVVCYFLGPDNIELMEKTLQFLEQEIQDKLNIETGNFGCFEIQPSHSAILLKYPEKIKNFLNLIKDSPVEVIYFEKDIDPRPLYLIPYDPNIQQTREEQEFCRRILLERILEHVISGVGGADTPSSITFTTEEFLNQATLGVYEIWEDNEAKKHIRRVVKDFLQDIISYESGKGWTFDLKDKETQEELLKRLQKFKPETLDLSKQVQPDLFDTKEA